MYVVPRKWAPENPTSSGESGGTPPEPTRRCAAACDTATVGLQALQALPALPALECHSMLLRHISYLKPLYLMDLVAHCWPPPWWHTADPLYCLVVSGVTCC